MALTAPLPKWTANNKQNERGKIVRAGTKVLATPAGRNFWQGFFVILFSKALRRNENPLGEGTENTCSSLSVLVKWEMKKLEQNASKIVSN
jgi:hypothetical protein